MGVGPARGLSASDDLGYLNEFEHIVLARLLVAQGAVDGAADTSETPRR